MSRKLTPKSSLDSLKREAKRWLKALHSNAADARARLDRILPGGSQTPTLRDVQHALARELGFPGWSELKAQLALGGQPADPREALVRRFLDNACPDHHVRGGGDHVRAMHTAMRLLTRHPEIAHASFATEVVCGELTAVKQALVDQPGLALARDSAASDERAGSGGSGDLYSKDLGPKGWEPLLFLCFTRLPLPAANENAVAIARALLERGADPNVYFMAGGSRYTPLVGAIGEGEEGRPAHPQRDALVRLLLEHGAEPYDMQVGYNVHFKGDVLWLLELIYERAIQLGRQTDWDDPEWPMLAMGNYGSGARWYLGMAIKNDDLALAEWCLAHGAGPNAAPPKAAQLSQQSLYEQAVRRGQAAMAELLVRYGATPVDVALSDVEQFTAACLRLDRDEIAARLTRHPELIAEAAPLLAAARRDRVDVVRCLLDLGMSPNVESAKHERPLHAAAQQNSVNVARLLIERGADVDPVESNWGGTPMGNASYAQHREVIDLLSEYSRDVWELVYAGKLERLKVLFVEQPELARIGSEQNTPLMWLPTFDEDLAMNVARLLIAYGADPTPRNKEGMTAVDRAERLGMTDVAAMLRAASTNAADSSTVEQYDHMAANLLEAYRTGTHEAMQRHWNDTWHRRSWEGMKRYVQLDLGRRPEVEDGDVEISIDDARWLVAREHGFEQWQALVDDIVNRPIDALPATAKPVRISSTQGSAARHDGHRTLDWDAALEAVRAPGTWSVDAAGQMTDDLLARVSRLEHVTSLRIGRSPALTNDGLRHLANMPQLRELDLSGCAINDKALDVLRELPALERVDLAWTATGDGAIAALVDKPKLRHFRSGQLVTAKGLPNLHRFPLFKEWHGGDVALDLLSPDAEPNSLMLRGTFGDKGLVQLAGLDGLFGLNVDDTELGLTAAALAPLVTLANLGFLAFDATDEAMPYIASMPKLRFLLCQDTTAGDDGFAALSRSQSIEYIWGRRCHNLGNRGFASLADMPALRGLSVSCKNVGDAGLSALPRFAALRELMPMDVPDDGYRYVGQCRDLESLILMYCRDTTDVATEHIAGLTKITRYLASYTRITNRTPEILGAMPSLEGIQLSACPGVTNAGVVALAGLPHLRELRLSGMQNVTRESVAHFPTRVHVDFSL
jgi:ankyrin repeat protein